MLIARAGKMGVSELSTACNMSVRCGRHACVGAACMHDMFGVSACMWLLVKSFRTRALQKDVHPRPPVKPTTSGCPLRSLSYIASADGPSLRLSYCLSPGNAVCVWYQLRTDEQELTVIIFVPSEQINIVTSWPASPREHDERLLSVHGRYWGSCHDAGDSAVSDLLVS